MYRAYIARQANLSRIVSSLKDAVAAGVDVKSDPKYKEMYLVAETELGPQFNLFVFENNNRCVIKNEESKMNNG